MDMKSVRVFSAQKNACVSNLGTGMEIPRERVRGVVI